MNQSEVFIYGTSYVIRGDADQEYVRRLAAFVDEKMRLAAKSTPKNLPVHKVAVLAAMNIADEYHKLLARQEAVERMVHDKTGDLFDLLDSGE